MKPIANAGFLLLIAAIAAAPARADGPERFSFTPHLALSPPARTLNVGPVVIDGRTVQVNGGDSAQPAKPFLIDWGDGKQTESWFPTAHTYARPDRNFVIKVTATYRQGTDTARADVRFAPDRYEFKRDRAIPRRVFIPRTDIALGSTMPGYKPPPGTSCFRDDEITPIPRDVIQYLLDVGHHIQLELCNRNVTAKAAERQVLLKQAAGGGASLWFTDPVSFVCHPAYLAGSVDLSSLLHELAHNLTLNSPARYRFGGKTDGPMNTIVSETLAQIFQHATIHTILNANGHFGLSDDVCRRLEQNGIASTGVVREAYRRHLAAPSRYTTYNDHATP
ncbi:MAG: hypothetical protein ACYSWU_25655, partial [Planctomycetota bacterium]